MEELREILLEQGIWEREIDDVLSHFGDDVTEDDLVISAIFDSAFDLGQYYIDNCVGELDQHIAAVLDVSELGKEVANEDEAYVILNSGRIVEFER